MANCNVKANAVELFQSKYKPNKGISNERHLFAETAYLIIFTLFRQNISGRTLLAALLGDSEYWRNPENEIEKL